MVGARFDILLLVLSCKFLLISSSQNYDSFVRDIIETFHYRSPTIIYDEYAPDICMTSQWMLCMTNGPHKEGNELADYFTKLTQTIVYTRDNRFIISTNPERVENNTFVIYPEAVGLDWTEPQVQRRHDVLIFLGGVGQKELVTWIDKRPSIKSPNDPDDQPGAFFPRDFIETPTIFTSDTPVFMPIEYADAIKLRLDTNIIFFKEEMPGSYKLVDMFAVKNGPPIALNLGKWHLGDGISLQMSIYRWKRRTDLRGASIINCYRPAILGPPVLDEQGKIVVPKWAIHPLTLLLIAYDLNLNVETTKICAYVTGCNYTCWCNCTGQEKHVMERTYDVDASGQGISFYGEMLVDSSFATGRWHATLYAAKQNGTAPNMWVYINVFEISQWATFVALLIAVVILISLNKKFERSDSVIAFGTKRGSQYKYKLESVMSGVALVGLYTIQMGSQVNGQRLVIRLLSFTASMLTLLMFVYYTTDITSQMTSGPKKITVDSFDDVLYHGYRVITQSAFLRIELGHAGPGTSKQKVSKEMITMDARQHNFASIVQELVSDSNTLFYSTKSKNLEPYMDDLKIKDGTNGYYAFSYPKQSEFLQILNYHMIKRYENGASHYTWSRHYYDNSEQFGMLEPEPLGYNNVLFPFMCLGLTICAAVVIAMLEFAVMRWQVSFVAGSRRTADPVRDIGREGTIRPKNQQRIRNDNSPKQNAH